MAKTKHQQPNKYVQPSFKRQVQYVLVPEAFKFSGDLLITSRHLAALLVEHLNETQGQNHTIEHFRVKPNDQNNKSADATPPGNTPAA